MSGNVDTTERKIEAERVLRSVKGVEAVENAIQVWQEILAVKPDAQKARTVLRELYIQQGRFDDLEREA